MYLNKIKKGREYLLFTKVSIILTINWLLNEIWLVIRVVKVTTIIISRPTEAFYKNIDRSILNFLSLTPVNLET